MIKFKKGDAVILNKDQIELTQFEHLFDRDDYKKIYIIKDIHINIRDNRDIALSFTNSDRRMTQNLLKKYNKSLKNKNTKFLDKLKELK